MAYQSYLFVYSPTNLKSCSHAHHTFTFSYYDILSLSLFQARDIACFPIFHHDIKFKVQPMIMFNKCVWLTKLEWNIDGKGLFKIPRHPMVFKFSNSVKNVISILIKDESLLLLASLWCKDNIVLKVHFKISTFSLPLSLLCYSYKRSR